MLVPDAAHQCCSGRQYLVDENEDGLFWRELDTFANDVHKLSDSQVCGNEILLLVDGRDIGFLDLLADDRDAISIFLADPLCLCLALLEGMLVFKLGSHIDGIGCCLCVRVMALLGQSARSRVKI